MERMSAAGAALPPIHALFLERYAGDDALLKLAGLRFGQEGLAAETYADTPDQLDRVLPYVPPHPRLPTVHLNRGLNMLRERDRGVVEEFAARFAGRLSGIVVHDQADMGGQTGEPGGRAAGPGPPPGPLARCALGVPRVCGAPGARLVRRGGRAAEGRRPDQLLHRHRSRRYQAGVTPGSRAIIRVSACGACPPPTNACPAWSPTSRTPWRARCRTLLAMTGSIGRLGKNVHFHLHDGHPLVGGLPTTSPS